MQRTSRADFAFATVLAVALMGAVTGGSFLLGRQPLVAQSSGSSSGSSSGGGSSGDSGSQSGGKSGSEPTTKPRPSQSPRATASASPQPSQSTGAPGTSNVNGTSGSSNASGTSGDSNVVIISRDVTRPRRPLQTLPGTLAMLLILIVGAFVLAEVIRRRKGPPK